MAIEIATVSNNPAASPRHGGSPEVSRHERVRLSPLALIMLLTVALGVTTLVSLATGAVSISPRTIFAAMLGYHPLTEMQRLILFHLRLPRVLAVGVGGRGAGDGRSSLPGTLSQSHRRSLRHRISGRRHPGRLHRDLIPLPVVSLRFQRHYATSLHRLGGYDGAGVLAGSIGGQDQRGDPSAGRFCHQHHASRIQATSSSSSIERATTIAFWPPGCTVSSAYQPGPN